MRLRTDPIKSRSWLPGASLLVFALAAITQADRQLFSSDAILERAKDSGKFTKKLTEMPTRGEIVSADGIVLAGQGGGQSLIISFKGMPTSPSFDVELSALTGIPASEFAVLRDSKVSYRTWPVSLTPGQLQRFEELKGLYKADGVSISSQGERRYIQHEEFSAIVGAMAENKGVAGIERQWNAELAGKPGSRFGLLDREGELLTMRSSDMDSECVQGKTIELTLDSQLQKQATRAIREAVELNKADSGVALVMKPDTGDILAMAQWPVFDGSKSKGEKSKGPSLGFNAASMNVWEPGSTFKILTLAKALDSGGTTMNRHLNCGGRIQITRARSVGCDEHGGTDAHGSIDATTAIAKSCNVSAARWAQSIGHGGMVEYLDSLGLTRSTQLGLPLEGAGQYNKNEPAKGLQLATMGFGQSLTVTPVGLIGAFGAIANGGIRMEPRMIASVGGVPTEPHSTGRVLTAESCRLVLDAMVEVIESDIGTGKDLRIPGYELGGKTGTAEKVGSGFNPNGRKGYVSNFVGFVPARNPQVVILIMVDNPQVRYYGASVAGPVFVELARASIELLGIPKESSLVPAGPKAGSSEPPTRPKPKIRVTSRPAESKP